MCHLYIGNHPVSSSSWIESAYYNRIKQLPPFEGLFGMAPELSSS